jgi:undecaprenyl-diphosphatase
MDPLYLGCSLLKISFVHYAMDIVGYFGHGLVGVPLGLALIGVGYRRQNQRLKRAGLAVLISISVAGLFIETLKHIFQIPRPRSYGSYGFPSGHAGTAFALASSLSLSFSALTPLYFFLATMTAVSRLYFRAHYLIDVLAGGLLGAVTGLLITRKILPPATALRTTRPLRRIGWLAVGAVGVAALAFFSMIETAVHSYRVAEPTSQSASMSTVAFDFGTPAVRRVLGSGWSGDEIWKDGEQSVVWAQGLRAQMRAAFPTAAGYRWRLNLYPYTGRGPACRVVEVIVNKATVAKMLLEQGWHWYEFDVPAGVIRSGDNEVEFLFNFSESPQSLGRSADPRPRAAGNYQMIAAAKKTAFVSQKPGRSERAALVKGRKVRSAGAGSARLAGACRSFERSAPGGRAPFHR